MPPTLRAPACVLTTARQMPGHVVIKGIGSPDLNEAPVIMARDVAKHGKTVTK